MYVALSHSVNPVSARAEGHSVGFRAAVQSRFRTFGTLAGLLVLACGAVSGCDEPSSPQGAVQRAAVALVKQDSGALRASLTGAALRRIDEKGTEALTQALKGRNLQLAPAELRYRDEPVPGFDRLRIYSVPVMDRDRGSLAADATVLCSVHWISRAGYAYREPVLHKPRGAASDSYTPVESCRVTEVRLPNEPLDPDSVLCQKGTAGSPKACATASASPAQDAAQG